MKNWRSLLRIMKTSQLRQMWFRRRLHSGLVNMRHSRTSHRRFISHGWFLHPLPVIPGLSRLSHKVTGDSRFSNGGSRSRGHRSTRSLSTYSHSTRNSSMLSRNTYSRSMGNSSTRNHSSTGNHNSTRSPSMYSPSHSIGHWNRKRRSRRLGHQLFNSLYRAIGLWRRMTVYRVAVLVHQVCQLLRAIRMAVPIQALTVRDYTARRVGYTHLDGLVPGSGA